MFTPRLTRSLSGDTDPDGLKLYTLSATGDAVDPTAFLPRLEAVKRERNVDWAATPAFAILHQGASAPYLVVAWWSNGNELFTSVSVYEDGAWIEDPERYSFCLWDLEIFWHERNSFIRHCYSGSTDLTAYRKDLAGPAPS